MPEYPFFVYGTLRPGGSLYRGIAYLVARHQPATLVGYDLFDSGVPAVRQSANWAAEVHGDLLFMRDHEQALRRCDHIERYHPPSSMMYVRAAVGVHTTDQYGPRVTAWVYLGGPGFPFRDLVPSGDWNVVKAARDAEDAAHAEAFTARVAERRKERTAT